MRHWQHTQAARPVMPRVALAFTTFALVITWLLGKAEAQSFVSGSTGADGPFAPTQNQAVQVPPGGVFNFTTISIPNGVTITFTPNATNSPVIMLATGNVSILGNLNLNGGDRVPGGRTPGLGGPGGFRGGLGGLNIAGVEAGNGDGPGGGGAAGGFNGGNGGGGGYSSAGGNGSGVMAGVGGPSYGSVALLQLIGGSGGGGAAFVGQPGNGGGGGGGAILIASSTSILFGANGSITCIGGSGGGAPGAGGGGAGGAIRLASNSITGFGTLTVSGGPGGGVSPSGASGFIRIEAFDVSNFRPTVQTDGPVSFALPQPAISTTGPALRFASIGGVPAPASPIGSLQGAPDVIVPSSQTNPVQVALQAANIPVGITVTVTVTPTMGARTTVQSTPLSGTTLSSTATASVTLPDGVSVLTGTAVVPLSASAKPIFIDGERVDKIEIAAKYGGPSELTYITESGRRVKKMD